MMRGRLGVVWAGLGLIILGLAAYAAGLLGRDGLWPRFPTLAGLGVLAGFFIAGGKEGGLVFLGTLVLLSGLFLFGFTFGAWAREEMSTLWPAFLVIAESRSWSHSLPSGAPAVRESRGSAVRPLLPESWDWATHAAL